jgi:purine nucleosidase/pyrimidine-specific ribonucleoside hydrolase
MTIKVIIDTDIGDDIDDAYAIAYALRCPELEIVGITTVLGNAGAKARIAAHLLREAGMRGIPVHAGCGLPLLQPAEPDRLPNQYIPEEMADLPIASAHAVDFIIETAMNAPGEIELLAIGPLTNVAMALRKEPSIASRIKRIVIMGGSYYFHFVEWNVYCDPEAADIVFRSGVPLDAVGMDVTRHCLMSEAQWNRMESGADRREVAMLLRLTERWRSGTGRKRPILHDALAVYGLHGGDGLRFEREAIQVELEGAATRGMTFNRTDRNREEQLVSSAGALAAESRVRVAIEADAARFIDSFLDRLLQEL